MAMAHQLMELLPKYRQCLQTFGFQSMWQSQHTQVYKNMMMFYLQTERHDIQ